MDPIRIDSELRREEICNRLLRAEVVSSAARREVESRAGGVVGSASR